MPQEQRELDEILEDLKESKDHLDEQEAEVSQAKMHRDDALQEYESILEELESSNYDEYIKWKESVE